MRAAAGDSRCAPPGIRCSPTAARAPNLTTVEVGNCHAVAVTAGTDTTFGGMANPAVGTRLPRVHPARARLLVGTAWRAEKPVA